ncbi:hypothetical protein JTB14_001134 [Gonioctena quinquepunctata]|nr:hypothetical protein JTB14_001134 [Gonioctena quinquepunctata]
MEEGNTTNTPVYGDQKESNDNISMAMDSSLEIKIKMERLIIGNECLKRLLEGRPQIQGDPSVNEIVAQRDSGKDHISVGCPQIQGDPSDNEIVPQRIKTQRDSENINKQTSTNTFSAETKQKMDKIINLENHDMDDGDDFTKGKVRQKTKWNFLCERLLGEADEVSRRGLGMDQAEGSFGLLCDSRGVICMSGLKADHKKIL